MGMGMGRQRKEEGVRQTRSIKRGWSQLSRGSPMGSTPHSNAYEIERETPFSTKTIYGYFLNYFVLI